MNLVIWRVSCQALNLTLAPASEIRELAGFVLRVADKRSSQHLLKTYIAYGDMLTSFRRHSRSGHGTNPNETQLESEYVHGSDSRCCLMFLSLGTHGKCQQLGPIAEKSSGVTPNSEHAI